MTLLVLKLDLHMREMETFSAEAPPLAVSKDEIELVIMVPLFENFHHSRTGYHGYSRHFNILELVTMVTLVISLKMLELLTMVTQIVLFQHSRSGYYDYSNYIISTF